MKLILNLVTWCLYFIQIVDSKIYRLQPNDELYPYLIDKSVPSYPEYFSDEHLTMEQIDDDQVRVEGYGLCVKSMDPKLLLQFAIRTQYLDKSTWYEGALQLIIPDICSEFLNPSRFWYNITKLWTNCPPQKGEKWVVESQIIDLRINLPPSFPVVPWRGYILLTQGLFGGVTKVGAMVQVELIEIV